MHGTGNPKTFKSTCDGRGMKTIVYSLTESFYSMSMFSGNSKVCYEVVKKLFLNLHTASVDYATDELIGRTIRQ